MTKPEYKLQVSVVNWLKLAFPDVLFTISPAGLITSTGIAMKVKNMGYRAGTPDLLIFESRAGFNGLFIELKAGTEPTEKQVEFMRLANDRGYKSVVCYTLDAAQMVIKTYLSFLG